MTTTSPVLLFPVMGAAMWDKAVVKRNVEQLRGDGYDVIEPVWRESFDASLGKRVGHPSLPPEPTVLDVLRRHMVAKD